MDRTRATTPSFAVIAVDAIILQGWLVRQDSAINLNSKGRIPVAILTTPEFDASLVLADSIRFGPGEAPPAHYQLEDVDKDGDLDLILHFRTRLTGIESDATEASITGYSYDPLNRLIPPTAVSIKGTDSVRIVPPKGKK